MRKILYILLLLYSPITNSQIFGNQNWGVTGGVHLRLGTHINRIGLSAQVYSGSHFFQVNYAWQGYFALDNWGDSEKVWEMQNNIGVVLFAGNPTLEKNPFIDVTRQQFGKPLAIGYAYKWFLNNNNTSQFSGQFGLQVYRFHFTLENDLFGGAGRDRFRTAAFELAYQMPQFWYGIQTVLYTGSYNSDDGVMRDDEQYPSRFGYRNMDNAIQPNASHGIVAANVNYALPYAQIISGKIGIDAEQIRHFFQNKLIHDRKFLPEKWVKKGNPHYPMRTIDGKSYLFQPNQEIKKVQPFIQFDVNPIGFY